MKPFFIGATLLIACAAAHAGEHRAYLRGYAYDLETGRFIYSELHEARLRDRDWLGGSVRFFGPDGREFGRKSLDFARDPFVPLYRLELDGGYVDGISAIGEDVTMLRRKPGGALRTDAAARAGLLAADSGLPRLIAAHLPGLQAGRPLEFRVAAPARLETYRFAAHRVADETFEGRRAVAIRLDMDSMLRLFAGPLIFVLEPESARLLEFRGATNIHPAADGEMHKVRISYYSAPPPDATGVPALPR